MSNLGDKATHQSLTPKQQLENLVDGLCDEPFELDSEDLSLSEASELQRTLLKFARRGADSASDKFTDFGENDTSDESKKTS
jgi:hypothetical protein